MAEDKEGKNAIAAIPPRHLGDRNEIVGMRNRLLGMMPNAASLPQEVLLATAQLAVAYRLDPFNGEIYVARMGREKVGNEWVDRYAPIIGIKGFRALARRASNYTVSPSRLMDVEETRRFRRDLFDEGDIGVEISLYRLDVARECKDIGVPYHPSVGRGFYRVKAKAKKDKEGRISGWEPDNIPETWTAFEVAEKRAEKSAIVKAFDLRVPVDQLVDETFDYDMAMERMAEQHDRETAITVRPEKYIVEDDGEILYAAE